MNEQKIFTVGTLRYTVAGIRLLFVFLLWNDVVLMMMEGVPRLCSFIWKEQGATLAQMAFWANVTGVCTLWINPVFSTWSDRARTWMGRRRPFLLVAAPPCALFLALIPFMPDLAHWMVRWPWVSHLAGGNASTLAIPLLGVCSLLFSGFNAVILSIFMYYFWDVVPEPVLGRFQTLTKMAAAGAAFVWSYFIFGKAEHHRKIVFIVMATTFAVVYIATLWKVREGQYPPPEPRKGGGFLASGWEAIRTYFADCYSHPRYLWIFGTFVLVQVGNQTGPVKDWLNYYQLHMDLDTIGKWSSWGGIAILLLGYPVGPLIDRFGAMRMVMPFLFLSCLANLLSFAFLRGPWSLLMTSTLLAMTNFAYATCVSTLTVEVFPTEKLGQFCSANAMSQMVVCWVTAYLAGKLFDWLGQGYYHYAYLWAAVFYFLGMLGFIKVYADWKCAKAIYTEPAVESCLSGAGTS